jgi:transcriptional regulator with XRE-family HTH domain
MIKRSLLSKYVKLLRERRGLSVALVSTRAGVDAVEYLKFEEAPHSIPLAQVNKYLNALSASGFELIYFQIVARASLVQIKFNKEEVTKTSKKCEKKLQLDTNVLSLQGICHVHKKNDEPKSENEEC